MFGARGPRRRVTQAQARLTRIVHSYSPEGRRLTSDPKRARYGCFLPDLTGLASVPSVANLPPYYIRTECFGSKALLVLSLCRAAAIQLASCAVAFRFFGHDAVFRQSAGPFG